MTTVHDFDRTALAPRADDFDPTGIAPRGDDVTSAWAWASSPLGNPADEAGGLAYGYDSPTDAITPAAKRRPIDKLVVAAGLIGVIGAGAALGIALLSTSPQPRPVSVAPGSTGAPAGVPAAGVPAPVVNPPDNGPAPAAAVTAPDNPPPSADPGTPPAATPPGPVVMVNVPPPAVWVPVPPPQLPPPPSLPPLPSPPKLPAPPKLPPPPPPPFLCLPPHHLVQGVCK
jgi:hypothetical protein